MELFIMGLVAGIMLATTVLVTAMLWPSREERYLFRAPVDVRALHEENVRLQKLCQAILHEAK